LEVFNRKYKNLTKPYEDVARICIKSIPGFKDNQEIDDLISKSLVRNIYDSSNMSQDDKNELMMLGFLTMTRKK
jgi:hypothetical protein